MDLMGAARQLRLRIKVAARCPWRDMDVRLSAIERQGAEVGRHASRAALYAPPGVADAGRLVEEGRRLVGRPVPAVGCAAPRPAAGPRRTRWARWIRRAGSASDARCAAALGGRRRAQPVRGAGGSRSCPGRDLWISYHPAICPMPSLTPCDTVSPYA